MSSVSLSIRKNPSKTAKILLVFNYGRKKRLRYPTQFNLKNYKNWDNRNRRIKIVKEEPTAEQINQDLSKFLSYAEKLVRVYDTSDIEIDNNKIKKDLEELFLDEDVSKKLKSESKNQDFIKYFEWFLDFYSKHPRPKSKKAYSKGTLKTLRNTKELLERFQKNRKRLKFDDITLTFHQKLLDYMSKHNYSINYKGTIVKNVKAVMHDAFERDFHKSLYYTKSAFTKPTEEVENVYLNEEEIQKITKVDLKEILFNKDKAYFEDNSKKPYYDYLERCRDFFLIGCHTGLRVSDLLKLTQKNILEFKEGDKMMTAIAIETKKTEKRIEIPIKRDLQKILDKYDNNFPPKVSDSRINLYIKKVCKAAGINEAVKMKIIEGGETSLSSMPKYKRVASHTARRSFCTNAFNGGMQPIDIMSISGHKTEKAFFIYIKSTSRDRFSKIKGHAFFQ